MQIFNYGNPSASTVLIQPVDDHDLEEMKAEIDEIRKQVQTDFQLIAVMEGTGCLWKRRFRRWSRGYVTVYSGTMFG